MAQLLDADTVELFIRSGDKKRFILEYFHTELNVHQGYLNIKTRRGYECQKFPLKSIPHGFKQNNSLALAECIQSCCSCTVVHGSLSIYCLNVFVFEINTTPQLHPYVGEPIRSQRDDLADLLYAS